VGKDIGVFASGAILNDMTLLGVGSAAGPLRGNTTTLGRIGSGFIYADFKPQISYTTPNFNGFSATGAVTQAWDSSGDVGMLAGGSAGTTSQPAFEGQVSYAFAADAVTGKVWASAISQQLKDAGKVTAVTGVAGSSSANYVAAVTGVAGQDQTARAYDIGANLNAAGFGVTGYYSEGKGIGHQYQFRGGLDAAGNKRKSSDWYTQATYTLPGVGTKLGVSYGESELKDTTVDTKGTVKTDMWTFGAYHPITKHLNLVAEYSEANDKQDAKGANAAKKSEAKTVSLGAILFF
jgi:hypothetical protein